MEHKTCPLCDRKKPFDSFEPDPQEETGCSVICKDCISDLYTQSLRAKAGETCARSDENIRSRLEAELLAAAPGDDGDFSPHVGTLFEEMTRRFGGARGFSVAWAATYGATDPKGNTRAKMLSDYLKLGALVTQEGKSKSLENMTDEELKIEAERRKKMLTQAITLQMSEYRVESPRGIEAPVEAAGA